MITKAIIESVDSDYQVTIRIPTFNSSKGFDNSTSRSILNKAIICTIPKGKFLPEVGDIVFVAFEDNDIGKPVIIGCLAKESGNTSSLNLDLASLKVDGFTQLSNQIKIGDITYKELENLKGCSQNIEQSLNNIISETSYNPNLLINSDFKVSQRGINNAQGAYPFDRWINWIANATYSIDPVANCLKIVVSGNGETFQQYLELNESKKLYGKAVTVSTEVSSDGIVFQKYNSTLVLSSTGAGQALDTTILGGAKLRVGINSSGRVYVHLWINNNQTIYIKYVKLELGNNATLFSPRSYSEELSFCQMPYTTPSNDGDKNIGISSVFSNPNLLINGDFRVNQRGQLKYTGAGDTYSVDKWFSSYGSMTMKPTDSGIELTTSGSGSANYGIFCQYVTTYIAPNTNVVLSCKVNGTIYSAAGTTPSSYLSTSSYFCDSGKARVRWRVDYGWQVEVICGSNTTLTVEWVKFEIGSVATIFCPRNYSEELAACQMPSNNLGISTTFSNPNLLINPDFRINQNGESTYNNSNAPSGSYTVDKWIHYNNYSYTLKQNTDTSTPPKITYGVTVTATGGTVDFAQIIDNGYNLYKGKSLIASFKVGNLIYSTPSYIVATNTAKMVRVYQLDSNGMPTTTELGQLYIECTAANLLKVWFRVLSGKTLVVDWVKLEEGTISTPFVFPIYREELDPCGNYINYKDTGTQPSIIQPLLDMIYPIGSIRLSFNSDESNFMGGTWIKIEDRFLLGASNNHPLEEQDGEETHQLTIDEMPSHSHSSRTCIGWQTGGGNSVGRVTANNGDYNGWPTIIYSTGGDNPHNNMPPYIAVYIWKRTA